MKIERFLNFILDYNMCQSYSHAYNQKAGEKVVPVSQNILFIEFNKDCMALKFLNWFKISLFQSVLTFCFIIFCKHDRTNDKAKHGN